MHFAQFPNTDTHWLNSFCIRREPISEQHLLPASPSEREIAVPVSALASHNIRKDASKCKMHIQKDSSHSLALSLNRKWTALCFYWLATSSTDAPMPGYARITSVWSTSVAPIQWSRTRPWNSSPSQTGRHAVWKQCVDSKQEKVIVSRHILNNCTIFHELNQMQRSLLGFKLLRGYCLVWSRFVRKKR